MLSTNYSIIYNFDAIGANIRGDFHGFKITPDGTALLTTYNLIKAECTGMPMFRGENGWVIDSVFQEVNISTGELLFELEASDHFRTEEFYITNLIGDYFSSIPFDFVHIDSVDKDTSGNYLISSRHLHSVCCIDGRTGQILWGLGGHPQDS